MGSIGRERKQPHAVLIPYPAQGHVTPFLKLAKLLHSSYNFHITFVNTEFNHRRLLRSRGPHAFKAPPGFMFETIPDGLPASDADATQDIPALCATMPGYCPGPFRDMLTRVNSGGGPQVSVILSDTVMSFTLEVAEELGIPLVMFWTPSACGIMGYLQYQQLLDRGLFPLKNESDLSNGFLDTPADWFPGTTNMRLKDFPSFVRSTNSEDIMFRFCNREAQRAHRASAMIINTFDDFEQPILDSMAQILPRIYTIGPLNLLHTNRIPPNSPLNELSSSLWKEDTSCIQWLEGKEPRSVVLVNFGSITVMTNHQLMEFAWGLAYSKRDFLWVIRPDIIKGDAAVLPAEFVDETRERGLLTSWCPQEAVLAHPSIGGFLTHSGWNSTLESICGGVPMICWPFFAEQQTNCRYSCTEWGIGLEIDNDIKRQEVAALVGRLMGEEGEEMRRRALEWKERAIMAAKPGGSSFVNFEKLVSEVLLPMPCGN